MQIQFQDLKENVSPRVLPVTHFVLKIASRCNLNCSYCYMYNLGDLSYLKQPNVMSDEVLRATLEAIREHATKHKLAKVNLILHGGEPLLAGKDFFRKLVVLSTEILGPAITPKFAMQTNGTLLDHEWLCLLNELDIKFGISIDGTKEIHDSRRVDHAGKGSYDKIASAIKLIQSEPHFNELFSSTLTVIHPDADPVETYRELRKIGVTNMDFLLPDATFDTPPPTSQNSRGYGDWMIRLFNTWFEENSSAVSIRFFENIIGLILGHRISTDNIGGQPTCVAVVETDGGIEPVDVLKICGNEFTKLGLNVHSNSFDDLRSTLLGLMYADASPYLCQKCTDCPVVKVCGGGYLPHRFSTASGFENPSVYCDDLLKIINHVQNAVIGTLPKAVIEHLENKERVVV